MDSCHETLWRLSEEHHSMYPYGMVPSSIYHKDDETPSLLRRPGEHSQGGAAKDFKKQLENGIRLDKEHYLHVFPVWFSFKNIAVHLSTGKAATICARVLKDKELKGIAERQLFWVCKRESFPDSPRFIEQQLSAALYGTAPETVGDTRRYTVLFQ